VTQKVGEILVAPGQITEDVNRRAPRQAVNDLVFFTGWNNLRPKKKLVSGWGHAVANVNNATGTWVSLHDLRRTMASVAVGAGMNEVVRKLVLGHAGGDDVTLRSYTVIEDDVVRRELQLVEDRILAMAQGI
jgi:integrase